MEKIKKKKADTMCSEFFEQFLDLLKKKKIQDLELSQSLETIEFISLNYLKLSVSFTQFSD